MPSVIDLFRQFSQTPALARQTFGLDLGARTTRVARSSATMTVEPTCFVWHRGTRQPFTFGRQALPYVGKTPRDYEVVWPFHAGKVEQSDAFEVFVRLLFQRLQDEKEKPFHLSQIARKVLPFPTSVIWPVAAQMSGVQRTAVQRIFSQLNCSLRLIDKATAYQRVFHPTRGVLTVVDVGAQSMEVAVSLDGQVLLAETLDFGSDLLSDLLQQAIRQQHHLEIGWSTAEMIKAEAVTMPDSVEVRHLVVRGRDLQRGAPATVTVSSQDFHDVVRQFTQRVLLQWQTIWMKLDPEVLGKMGESGLWLAGNGGRLRGFAQTLEKNLQLEVRPSPFPGEEVVRGIWQK